MADEKVFHVKFHKGETTRTLPGLASQGEAFGRAALVAIARQGGPLAVSEISFCAYSVLYLIMILPIQFAIFEVENTGWSDPSVVEDLSWLFRRSFVVSSLRFPSFW